MIRRRSGIEKFELDLRRTSYRLAPLPLEITGNVFLSRRDAGGRPALAPLSRYEMLVMAWLALGIASAFLMYFFDPLETPLLAAHYLLPWGWVAGAIDFGLWRGHA